MQYAHRVLFVLNITGKLSMNTHELMIYFFILDVVTKFLTGCKVSYGR